MSILDKRKSDFRKDALFSYDFKKKRIFLFFSWLGIIALISFILYYILVLKHSDIILVKAINFLAKHITSNIGGATFLGVFYSSLFGGLFFVLMPTEVVFMAFFKAGHNPILLILVYILGFVFSYTFNYFVGMKLVNISKKIITTKKFYKIKGLINRHGVGAIFAFNAMPLFPSQPLSTILGVFKYNKTKFYLFFILGQLTKYSLITIIFIYFGFNIMELF